MDGYVTFLVTVCLSIIGSWYLQKNVVNALKGEIERLKDDIKKQEKQIIDQNALIEDLKSKYEESTKVKVPPGPQGVNGAPGAKGGIVYVRWGHDSCPDGGAQLVYAGRAGGSHFTHKGGGGNPQCLPLDPEYHQRPGATKFGYMYGAEYQRTDGLVADSDNTDVPCAVCHVPTRNTVYMLPAKYSCPEGWTREYFGHLMSEHHSHHRSDFSCVDYSLTPVIGSKFDHNGLLFYAVRGACGSLPCPNYIQDKELSCAVCTK